MNVENRRGMPGSDDLRERTFQFAKRIVFFTRRLAQRGPVQRRLALQLTDSGTSIGANLEEGCAGQTKPDFIAKNSVSLKESRESRYWLRLIAETEPDLMTEGNLLREEATEFVRILSKIIRTARSNPNRGESR